MLAGPPKTGNVWVKHMLLSIYGLKRLPKEAEPTETVESFRNFVDAGLFEEGSIFHQHFRYSAELCDLADAVPCHLVTVIRNPYDTFVSFYHYIQRFSDIFSAADTTDAKVIGKPIDDPDVLELLKGTFGYHLVLANEWVNSGRSNIVRYEALHADPQREIRQLTDKIEPVADARIAAAIRNTQADKMRKRNDFLAKHIRSASVDDWKNHLSEPHLEVFRTHHAGLVQGLGYEVL